MKLNNFKKYFDETILDRGYDYYCRGYVMSLEFDGETYTAKVAGSYDYTVKVSVSPEGSVTDASCDCPYDWGDYCKHQAAVFYAINEAPVKIKKVKGPKLIKQNLEELLRSLDTDTLIKILLEHAESDPRFKDDLLFRFGEKPDIEKYARKLIKSSIKAASRGGFIEYNDVFGSIEGAVKVLAITEDFIASGDMASAVKTAIIVLEEMMDFIQCCDDSDGHVGGMVMEAIDTLDRTTFGMDKSEVDCDKIFQMIFDHAKSEIYSGWSYWRIDILRCCIPFCDNDAIRKKLDDYFHDIGVETDDEDFYKYFTKQIRQLKYEIIKRFDGKDAALNFVDDHLNDNHFRKIAITNAIEAKQYGKAERLCLEGESTDKEHRGIVHGLQQIRYGIYEKTGNTDDLKEMAMTFVLAGEYEYYEKLKSLYPAEKWQPVLQDVLERLPQDIYGGGIYTKIIVAEGQTLRILEYCKKNITAIDTYYPHLVKQYKNDVEKLFLALIANESQQARNRKEYAALCRIIRHCKKACGTDVARTVKTELLEKHKRQPAFVDELGKLDL